MVSDPTNDEVTYFVRLGGGDTLDRPKGVLRRITAGHRVVDQSLGHDGEWHPTLAIDDAEIGELDDRLVPVSESEAEALVRGWTARDGTDGELRLSRVERDGDGRPVTPGRAPLERDERHAVARYLSESPMVTAVLGMDHDPLDPGRPEIVPLHIHTDGVWVWSESESYFAGRYGIAPDPELLAHIRRRQYRCPAAVDAETMRRAARLRA